VIVLGKLSVYPGLCGSPHSGEEPLSPTEVEDCGERAFKTHHPSAKPTNCPLRRDSLWRFAYPMSPRNYYLPNPSKIIREFHFEKN